MGANWKLIRINSDSKEWKNILFFMWKTLMHRLLTENFDKRMFVLASEKSQMFEQGMQVFHDFPEILCVHVAKRRWMNVVNNSQFVFIYVGTPEILSNFAAYKIRKRPLFMDTECIYLVIHLWRHCSRLNFSLSLEYIGRS